MYTQLKAKLGEGSPIPPLGRWERNFSVEFLTETPAFIASQKCHCFAFRQNHTTTPLAVVGRSFQPRLLEVDIPPRDHAREERNETYTQQAFQGIKKIGAKFLSLLGKIFYPYVL